METTVERDKAFASAVKDIKKTFGIRKTQPNKEWKYVMFLYKRNAKLYAERVLELARRYHPDFELNVINSVMYIHPKTGEWTSRNTSSTLELYILV